MASLDYRLNPLFTIRECSSCGALYNKSCGCSKGGLIDKFVRDPNKTPDLSPSCPKCGTPIDGQYCQGCALLRKKIQEDLYAFCDENGIFQDLQDISKSSKDNANVVNAPREPFLWENFDLTCYSEGKNSLTCVSKPDFVDDSPNVFNPPPLPPTDSYEFYGNDAYYVQPPQSPVIHQPPQEASEEILQAKENLMNSVETFLKKFNRISFRETPKVLSLAWEKFFEIKQKEKQHPPKDTQDLLHKLLEDVLNINEELAEYINAPSWNRPAFYFNDDDDEEYSFAITPDLPTEKPVDSFIMEDEHLDIILATKSDELIKSSVKNLAQNPSESEDSSDGECDLPPYDDSPKNHDLAFFNPLFDIDEDFTSSNESFFEEDIDSLVEFAGELTLLHSIPSGIDEVNLDPEGAILFLESSLYDNSSPRPPEEFNYKNPTESFSPSPIPVEDSDSLMDEIEIFRDGDDSIPPGIESDDFDSESADNSTSLPEFESFHVDFPNSGDSTINVVEDIPVDVPNILPTHLTLHMDFDFIPFSNDFGSNLDSSPSGDRNKIYDPGICIEGESTEFLATLSPVINILPPFSSENKVKVFNHDVLASKEKSSPSSSHRGFKASMLFHQKRPMIVPDFEDVRARGFVPRSLGLHIISFNWKSDILDLFD
ncbi:hypothetical protein Tco_0452221 [Tanacetum coccineum]